MFPKAVALFSLDFKALKAQILSEQPESETEADNADSE